MMIEMSASLPTRERDGSAADDRRRPEALLHVLETQDAAYVCVVDSARRIVFLVGEVIRYGVAEVEAAGSCGSDGVDSGSPVVG